MSPLGRYRTLADLPAVIAIFPLDGALLLPGGTLPLRIFEPRYLAMIDDALRGDRLIGMVQTRPAATVSAKEWPSESEPPPLARVGCLGRLTSYEETLDGCYLIGLAGVCRFRVDEELTVLTPYRQIRANYTAFVADLGREADGPPDFDRPQFIALLGRFLDRRGLGIEWEAVNAAPAAALIDSLAMALPFAPVEKQALLEAPELEDRRRTLAALLEIGAEEEPVGDDAPSPALQ